MSSSFYASSLQICCRTSRFEEINFHKNVM